MPPAAVCVPSPLRPHTLPTRRRPHRWLSVRCEIARLRARVRFLERCSRAGSSNRAIVAVVSDHGEGLGDHGEAGMVCCSTRSAGVPWIRAAAGRPARRRVSQVRGAGGWRADPARAGRREMRRQEVRPDPALAAVPSADGPCIRKRVPPAPFGWATCISGTALPLHSGANSGALRLGGRSDLRANLATPKTARRRAGRVPRARRPAPRWPAAEVDADVRERLRALASGLVAPRAAGEKTALTEAKIAATRPAPRPAPRAGGRDRDVVARSSRCCTGAGHARRVGPSRRATQIGRTRLSDRRLRQGAGDRAAEALDPLASARIFA